MLVRTIAGFVLDLLKDLDGVETGAYLLALRPPRGQRP